MSINWFEEKGNEGATAPSTSPVTSVIHLHCKQPVELRYSNEPGDDNTVFHDVFKTVCKHISEEHAELLKDTGVIVAGVNEDNHQHVVLLIGEGFTSKNCSAMREPADSGGPRLG